jgi:hypothetical protein
MSVRRWKSATLAVAKVIALVADFGRDGRGTRQAIIQVKARRVSDGRACHCNSKTDARAGNSLARRAGEAA